MPVYLKAIASFIAMVLPGVIARILGFLGLGLVSYVGVNAVTNKIIDVIQTNISYMPVKLLSLLGIAGVDVFISLIISTHIGGLTFYFFLGGGKKLTRVRMK